MVYTTVEWEDSNLPISVSFAEISEDQIANSVEQILLWSSLLSFSLSPIQHDFGRLFEIMPV